jgi:hypothetical protein
VAICQDSQDWMHLEPYIMLRGRALNGQACPEIEAERIKRRVELQRPVANSVCRISYVQSFSSATSDRSPVYFEEYEETSYRGMCSFLASFPDGQSERQKGDRSGALEKVSSDPVTNPL